MTSTLDFLTFKLDMPIGSLQFLSKNRKEAIYNMIKILSSRRLKSSLFLHNLHRQEAFQSLLEKIFFDNMVYMYRNVNAICF